MAWVTNRKTGARFNTDWIDSRSLYSVKDTGYGTGVATGKFERIEFATEKEASEYITEEKRKDDQIKANRDIAHNLNNQETQKDKDKNGRSKKAKLDKIKTEIKRWEDIQKDPYASPYLKNQSWSKLSKLRKSLEDLE